MQSFDKILSVFSKNHVIHRRTIERIAVNGRPYVIFIIARSGSTWLTDMAAKSGRLGVPQEWFNEDWIQTDELALGCRPPKALEVTDVDEYILRTVELTASDGGCFGVQLSPSQTSNVCRMLEDVAHACEVFSHFYLRRKNIVRQAISLYRSVRSGVFHSYQTDKEARKRFGEIQYDEGSIKNWCQHLVEGEIYFERVFSENHIQPERFFYEDLVSDPLSQLRRIEQKINPCGDSIRSVEFELTPLADAKTEQWETLFREKNPEFLAALEETRPVI
ncbi:MULTISPECIES: Stf0 family sulfotransferase [Burkholderia]|nr:MULTISPECIES: Stf0 family sulfotransferase [Burkholderia]MBJ9685250.1 hypothetical protein [Burkholderia multivorans]MBU9692278.1 hypothetical protein [Burkholderia multivorans]MDN7743568.1 Stf0 family sulfotransferase [Burkholderia multivorans]MDR9090054.1 hypothetical protein [Burkholderia multivorans]MDR9113766.1 hypothetical protein [Burkholderia multivorans]